MNRWKKPDPNAVPAATIDIRKAEAALDVAVRRARASYAASDREFAAAYIEWHDKFVAWLKNRMSDVRDSKRLKKIIYKYSYASLSDILKGAPAPPKNDKPDRKKKLERLEGRLQHLRFRVERKKPLRLTPEQLKNYLDGEYVDSRAVT